jgi:DNA-binding Xre family transcriptional regulator
MIRLTDEQIREIRTSANRNKTDVELAEEYGINKSQMSKIRRFKTRINLCTKTI